MSRGRRGDQRQPHGRDDRERPLGAHQQLRAGRIPRCPSPSPESRRSTRPSASTASSPATRARIVPWRRTCAPPASVATMPPSVAASRAPKSTPSARPDPRRAAASAAGVTPAPAVIWRATGSSGPMSVRRASESTTSPPRGTPPPTSPVLPPCGTTPTPAEAQRPTRRRPPCRARPHDARGGAAEAAGDVALVARLAGNTWAHPTISAQSTRNSVIRATISLVSSCKTM